MLGNAYTSKKNTWSSHRKKPSHVTLHTEKVPRVHAFRIQIIFSSKKFRVLVRFNYRSPRVISSFHAVHTGTCTRPILNHSPYFTPFGFAGSWSVATVTLIRMDSVNSGGRTLMYVTRCINPHRLFCRITVWRAMYQKVHVWKKQAVYQFYFHSSRKTLRHSCYSCSINVVHEFVTYLHVANFKSIYHG